MRHIAQPRSFWGDRRLHRRWKPESNGTQLKPKTSLFVIPAKAGGALQQTNVWSSNAFTLPKALDPRFHGDDEIKYAPFNSESIPLSPG